MGRHANVFRRDRARTPRMPIAGLKCIMRGERRRFTAIRHSFFISKFKGSDSNDTRIERKNRQILPTVANPWENIASTSPHRLGDSACS